MGELKIMLARVMMLLALVCGVLGVVVALIDRSWKLGHVGFFTGGTLLAVLAIVVLADYYFESRR